MRIRQMLLLGAGGALTACAEWPFPLDLQPPDPVAESCDFENPEVLPLDSWQQPASDGLSADDHNAPSPWGPSSGASSGTTGRRRA